MYHFSCHSFLIADYTRFSFYLFEESRFLFGIRRELVSKIGSCGALMYRKVSETSSLYYLANRIGMYMIVSRHICVELFFLFSFGLSHFFVILCPYLFPSERRYPCQFVHIGMWL
jgi:hypothetical protein